MCGLFGIFDKDLFNKDKNIIFSYLKSFIQLSSLRGGQGLGMCFLDNNNYNIVKEKDHIKEFINDAKFKSKIINNFKQHKKLRAFFGQTRLPIIGDKSIDENNSPIDTKNLIGIHNGNIIFKTLNLNNLEFSKKSDSNILFEEMSKIYDNDPSNYEKNFTNYLNNLVGEFSIVVYIKKLNKFYLTSNTGSLYFINNLNYRLNSFIFLSERIFLEKFIKSHIEFKGSIIKNIKKSFYSIDSDFYFTDLKK